MGAKPAPKPQISAGTRAACLPAPRTGPKIRNSREKAQKAQKNDPTGTGSLCRYSVFASFVILL
jgi:hypothetical protein